MNQEQSIESTPSLPTFADLPLSPELRLAIEELGYTHPTPVQREVYEPALRGRDIVVQARTGTGKTASFGMPVVDGLARANMPRVQVLILCPTRELALQVFRELAVLSKHKKLSCTAVYGGAPMARQIDELAAGAQILIGTPGRVLDHLERGTFDPSEVRCLILDESDEMLSMGFLPQINEIDAKLPTSHQTLLFSATLPADIQRHAETRLRDPLFLTLSGDHIGALDIQHFVYLTRGDKLAELERIVEVENPESAIVFTNTRDETKRVAAALERAGYAADWLNADLAQSDREAVMKRTREGRLRFLVCTDVAARGIDISHLTHVINFDFPDSPEGYVHRTGRTGRAGRTGMAISLVAPADVGRLYIMRLTYKIFPVERQLPTTTELRTRAELDVVEMFEDAFRSRQIHSDDLSIARRLMSHDAAERIVACLLRDHLGARPEAVRLATEARRAQTLPPPPAPTAASEPTRSPNAPAERTALQQSPVRQRDGAPSPKPRPRARADRNPSDDRRNAAAIREAEVSENSDAEDFGFRYTVTEPAWDQLTPSRDQAPSPAPRSSSTAQRETRRDRRPRNPADAQRLDNPAHAQRLDNPADAQRLDNPADAQRPDNPARGREIFINVGRRDQLTDRDLLAILQRAQLPQAAIRFVRIRHSHSFVGVDELCFEKALAALAGAEHRGRPLAAEPARGALRDA